MTSKISTFEEYEKLRSETAIYPGQGSFLGLIYVALKGAGEAGEFAENVGKAIRDDDFIEIDEFVEGRPTVIFNNIGLDRQRKLIAELGDQLWYLSAKAKELGTTLDEVAAVNVAKLQQRAKDGKLQGSGSDR